MSYMSQSGILPSNASSGSSGGCGVMRRACLSPLPGSWQPKEQKGWRGVQGSQARLSSYPKKPFERFSWQSLKLPFIPLAGMRPG